MKYRKSFNTIILNRKHISLFGALIVLGVMLGIIVFFSKTISTAAEKTNSADMLYKAALESQLPMSGGGNELKNLINSLLGFDITVPESIFLANPIFDENISVMQASAAPSVSPSAMPSAAPEQNAALSGEDTAEEYNIEEVKITKGMAVSNATTFTVDAAAAAGEALGFKIDKSGPQVLVIHTHTTESFTESGKNTYTSSDSDRSIDREKNIVKVGDKITEVLNNAGIKTIHDETVHDYPSYNGAYGRSLTTAKEILKANPTIKVVLDIHRDGLNRADGTKLKVTADIDGMKAAQVMLVVGTNGSGLSHDNWRENFKFAAKIQKQAGEMYPSLMRPINLREERFNQHLTTGSLIVEVGSNGNTLEEAVLGGEYFAKILAKVLN